LYLLYDAAIKQRTDGIISDSEIVLFDIQIIISDMRNYAEKTFHSDIQNNYSGYQKMLL